MADEGLAGKKILNINIGVLGHVDSGKTSLSKAISKVASTASFDKNPQSQERGITLDLGFSSFTTNIPEHLCESGYDLLQYTFVDCPGHASLIKTIIGGAQIIDIMILVVDIVKGMQTQTAECLVIGEILCEKMIVVLNKVDMVQESKRQVTIEKMKKRMLKTLENTRYANCPIVACAVHPASSENTGQVTEPIGLDELTKCLAKNTYLPKRDSAGDFLFSVDHCFSIRGQGTVMTGTVLNGSVSVNGMVEIPTLKVSKKVKSMQMFHKPLQRAVQGDRVGICVTQFDPKSLERGLVCTPGSLPTIYGGIIHVNTIPYFKGSCTTKSKFHVTIGHETVMTKLKFFCQIDGMQCDQDKFSYDKEYLHEDELHNPATPSHVQYLLLQFERPVTCKRDSLVIGSKLDADINLNQCRIAFHGKLLVPFDDQNYEKTVLPSLKIYKTKQREGIVDRLSDDQTVIVRSLFKKETNIELFTGLKVTLETGEMGIIEGGFGQSGKIKVRVHAGLQEETKKTLQASAKKKGKGKSEQPSDAIPQTPISSIKVMLQFKKYDFDRTHKIIQS